MAPKKNKTFDLNYFIMLAFLLVSANANIISSTTVAWAVIILGLFGVAMQRKQIGRRELNAIGVFAGLYVLYVSGRFFLVNDLTTDYLYSDYVFLFKYIFIAFLICVVLRDKLLATFVKVMVHLTIISLVFFALQLLAPTFMYKIFLTLNFPTGNTIPGYTNALFFTYTQGFHDFSNSGFVWEPGAFGCFLVLTLMFHFFLNKFRYDNITILLILANITTFSTTNYLGLLVLIFLSYRYRVPKINIYVLILVPASILAFIFIPFLGDKIIETYNEDMRDLKHLKVLEKYYHHNRMEIPLNRFSSMWHIIDTFQEKLILGVSNKYNDVLNKAYTVNISNGVFDFIAKFGIIGLLVLLYKYAAVCAKYVIRWENVAYCLMIILVLSFGEPILFLPIVMMFLFLKDKQTAIDKYGREEPQDNEPVYGRARAR
ncbi:O-antigen ligase family protein [Mucilaginibacter pedocola]|uniref:O-antigen ligase-related domain-containing protein n=1 Tax=Mucilaginibacter pedocola TaxID=1792845 RepID=A0A1S9P806_9SPHI|nr:O-antigen ligase family protein [Mucilaginibacter pedocola]OOQ57085.1 hypothetical protein BC343_16275 [Mucilaginibacter pedocola]